MKVSNYVINQTVCDNNRILYNLATRKYFAYKSEEHNYIKELIQNLNQRKHSEKEKEIIKALYSKGILIDDNLDELDMLEGIIMASESYDKERECLNVSLGESRHNQKVFQGIEVAVRNGIKVVLKVNIRKDNLNKLTAALENIDVDLRKNIYISFSNVHGEKEKVDAFGIKMYAYSLGYKSGERYNDYDSTDYLHNAIIKNEECRNCKELPLCLGGCGCNKDFKDDGKCKGKRADGMSLEEVAYLDYYYDVVNNTAGA